MSTLYESEKTHQQMLPQSAALEFASADNLKGMDETGREHRDNPVTGVQHGRGETVGDHLPLQRHSVEQDKSSEAEDRGQTVPPVITAQRVFVVDSHGHPLMPCHPARARELLHAGRARVHRLAPFVIRLVDRAVEASEVSGVDVGVDPGSKFTGVSVFRVSKENIRHGLISTEIEHRGRLIHKHMGQRSNYRRRRRTANLRYRKPRWANRSPETCASCGKNASHGSRYCRPCAVARSFVDNGYRRVRLAPSLQHRVDSVVSCVNRLRRWAPVVAIHQELVRFDMQKMENLEIAGVNYSRGALAGYEVREYLLEKWGRKCAYCGASGVGPGSVALNVDHIQPKARGGSDRVSNLTLACVSCNQAKGTSPLEEFLAGDPERLKKVLAQAKAPLRDAAAVNTTRRVLWRELKDRGLPVFTGSGGRTKWNRSRFLIAKSHTLDALCVGDTSGVASYPGTLLSLKATGRGSYSRATPDAYGFPRLSLPRMKVHHGFATGDHVRAVVPRGKHAGTHFGRVAVRSSGSFNIKTKGGTMQGISYRHCMLLQRGDGWGYEQDKEVGPRTRVGLSLRYEPTAIAGGFSSHTHSR
ncbi:MAG: RNA-guided endonuclease IscB [Acidimicrobiales bacterium]